MCGRRSTPSYCRRHTRTVDCRGSSAWTDTTSRGHVHATGARHDSHHRHRDEPADHGFGRSRGGWSTKIHLAVDAGVCPVSCVLTPGQVGDAPQMPEVLDRVRVPTP
ncbi:transposase, partial [Corynebacterium glyciniphilum]|uniref:transposase n=1 Tax=Corynebacterium glyciniphilum TaxID=1404244 RepID=UPI0034D98574